MVAEKQEICSVGQVFVVGEKKGMFSKDFMRELCDGLEAFAADALIIVEDPGLQDCAQRMLGVLDRTKTVQKNGMWRKAAVNAEPNRG